MLTEREINQIAIHYAKISKTEHYYLEFLCVKPSVFLDGYWDAGFKVLRKKEMSSRGHYWLQSMGRPEKLAQWNSSL